MPSSSLSPIRSARPPWLAMEGLTACSSTAMTRSAKVAGDAGGQDLGRHAR